MLLTFESRAAQKSFINDQKEQRETKAFADIISVYFSAQEGQSFQIGPSTQEKKESSINDEENSSQQAKESGEFYVRDLRSMFHAQEGQKFQIGKELEEMHEDPSERLEQLKTYLAFNNLDKIEKLEQMKKLSEELSKKDSFNQETYQRVAAFLEKCIQEKMNVNNH